MSEEKSVFKILDTVGENGLKIQKDGPGEELQTIQLENSQKIKNQEDKPGMLLTTDDGRQFARLDSWPENVLIEIH